MSSTTTREKWHLQKGVSGLFVVEGRGLRVRAFLGGAVSWDVRAGVPISLLTSLERLRAGVDAVARVLGALVPEAEVVGIAEATAFFACPFLPRVLMAAFFGLAVLG